MYDLIVLPRVYTLQKATWKHCQLLASHSQTDLNSTNKGASSPVTVCIYMLARIVRSEAHLTNAHENALYKYKLIKDQYVEL